MNRHLIRLFVALVLLSQPILSSPSVSAAAVQRLRRVDLIVSGGTVVTMDGERRVIEDGAVAVDHGRIVAVGKRSEVVGRYDARETVDASGRAVLPGLVNGHTHVPMTLFRGIADDLDLQEWLTKYIFPAEAKNVTEEFVRAGTQLGLAEMIRGGTTTYCDMYYFEDAVADETVRAGVRGVLGETVIDFPVPDNKTWADAMRYTDNFIRKWKGHALVTPAIAPHAPYTVSEAHLREVKAFSERTGAPIVIHVAETRKEVADITRDHGASPVEYLARIGFLGPRDIFAHTVHLTEHEINLLKQNGVGSVHNPQSNMKLASGVAPVPQMLKAGVAVGLGTDGAASNNDLDMWEEMDTAAKLHKVATFDPKVINAVEALAMATIEGARALHMDSEIGSLEAGKRADIVVVDLDSLHQTPRYNIYSHLVYATKASDVRTVVIEGRVVMRDRRLLTLDEEAIKQKARLLRERVSRSLSALKTPRGSRTAGGLTDDLFASFARTLAPCAVK
ncbi:MAG TPA: amidohydrolase [Pyrinomonadaceae bacterium]|jgi:5-methylthioadenosine/S-adenosylhomocysteine deaminase|nr:amidohydrolase [Pyrinomonadaceae bacterium]